MEECGDWKVGAPGCCQIQASAQAREREGEGGREGRERKRKAHEERGRAGMVVTGPVRRLI